MRVKYAIERETIESLPDIVRLTKEPIRVRIKYRNILTSSDIKYILESGKIHLDRHKEKLMLDLLSEVQVQIFDHLKIGSIIQYDKIN